MFTERQEFSQIKSFGDEAVLIGVCKYVGNNIIFASLVKIYMLILNILMKPFSYMNHVIIVSVKIMKFNRSTTV